MKNYMFYMILYSVVKMLHICGRAFYMAFYWVKWLKLLILYDFIFYMAKSVCRGTFLSLS